MDFKWLFDAPIAHRGLHDADFPENSMPAFAKAIEKGYNIEIDVHLTKDNFLVVFHDDNLKRVCGVDRTVKSCTLEEIKNIRLAGTEYTIPTFEEFLELVNAQVGILCEIKGVNPFDNSIIKATVDRLKTYDGNIALQSFNFGAVIYGKKHSALPVGELCTWHGTGAEKLRSHLVDFMGKLWICRVTNPDFIAYDIRALDKRYPENKWIKKWITKLPVLMWTINGREKMETSIENANGIIFEDMDTDYVDKNFPMLLPFKCPKNKLPSQNL